MHGPLALAHNGNIVNAPALRDELLSRGFGLTATSDTEVMTLMLAAAGGRTWEERLERTLPAWKGAFSLVLLSQRPGARRARPVGLPAAVGRPPPERRPRRRQRDVRAQHARLRRDRRGAARRDRHAAGRRDAPPPGARPGRPVGPLHVRVRLLLPPRLGVGRPQRPPRPPAARRRARARVPASTPTSSSRCPTPRSRPPSGTRRRQRHPVQRRPDQEPLHRPHVHRADPGAPRARRGAQVQRPRREPRRQAGRS